MDESRFDNLARTLATGTSRRRVITGLLGAVAGATRLGSAGAAPPPCSAGVACQRTADCCPAERCVDGLCQGVPGREHAHCHAAGCPTSADSCLAHVCNAQTGECDLIADPGQEGAACPGADPCYQTYACQAGACVGGNPVDCSTPPDACHTAGSCNPVDGSCVFPEVVCGPNEVCAGGECVCASGLVRCGAECRPCCPAGTTFPDTADARPGPGACCSSLLICTTGICECVCRPTDSLAFCPERPEACCSGVCNENNRCGCSGPGDFCNPVTQGGTPCCAGTCEPIDGLRYTGRCSPAP